MGNVLSRPTDEQPSMRVMTYAAYQRETHHLLTPDGTRIAYHLHRSPPDARLEGRRVILTNGIGTTENFWRFMVEALCPHFSTIHWDYRGHGQSERARNDDYRLTTQADDLLRLVAQTARRGEMAPVHVAFSMGVPIALEAYRKNPDAFSALVLIAGGAEAPWAHRSPLCHPSARRALRTAIRAATPLAFLAQPFWQRVLAGPFAYWAGQRVGVLRPRAPRHDIDAMMRGVGQMDLRAYLKTLDGLFSADTADVLPTVDVPTLVVAAQNDAVVPVDQVERMRAALPSAEYVVVCDAGHAGLVEAGQDIAQTVLSFLRSAVVSKRSRRRSMATTTTRGSEGASIPGRA